MGPGDKKDKKDECNPFEQCAKNRKFSENYRRKPKHKPNVPSDRHREEEDDDEEIVPTKSHVNPRMMGSPGSAAKGY